MEVIESGVCGTKDVRVVKREMDMVGCGKNAEVKDISYSVQIKILMCWHTIATWDYEWTKDLAQVDIDRSDLLCKMAARALLTNMMQYGRLQ